MSSIQQESAEGPFVLQDMLILEDSIQEVYLPEAPTEPEEPTTQLPPATFGPNGLPLTYDNTMLFGTQLIETHAQEHRLSLKATPFDFLQRVLHHNSTPENLWAFIKICDNPMKVGNVDFLRAFDFSSEASSSPGPTWGENKRQLYVRCFTLTAGQLDDIIDDWGNSGYFPEEAKTWANECRNQQEDDLVFIRYVGQCSFPRIAWERFLQDITSEASLFSRFAKTLSTLHPQVYQAAQVFAVRDPLSISSDLVDDFERMLICILGYDQLLNRALGGFYDPIELDDGEKNLFQSLQTNICSRWSQQKAPLAEDQKSRLYLDLVGMTQWANINISIVHSFSDEYMEKLFKEQTPHLYRSAVLTVLFADDVTLADFSQQQDYLFRFSNELLSRSSATTIDVITQLLKIDIGETVDLSKEHHFSIFPFKNLYPWLGARFPNKAREFAQRYLQTIHPLLVIGLGSNCSGTLAANLFHNNGFQSKTFLPFAGIPKVCHFAGDEWLKDAYTPEVPERSLFLLLPHLDPGVFKHYSRNRVLHKFNYLCWMVTLAHISMAMTILDEKMINPTRNRKQFLNELIDRAAQIMENAGLTGQLESARTACSTMFEKRSQEQFPRTPLHQELTRRRNSEAAVRSITEAESAVGDSGSAEREQQLLRLWKMNIGRLHTIIPHVEEQRPTWNVLMNEVKVGRFYAMYLMNKKQAQDSVAAGQHPLKHILGPRKPAFVSDQGDDWMWNDEITQPILSEHGRRMQSRRNLPADHFSSEKQRVRAFSGSEDVTFYGSVHDMPVLIRSDGRFYVYYEEPATNHRYTFTMYHKAAFSSEGAERRLVATRTGLAIVDEYGGIIPSAKGGTQDIVGHNEMPYRTNGSVLKLAWERSRPRGDVSVSVDASTSSAVSVPVPVGSTSVDDDVPVPVDATSVSVSVSVSIPIAVGATSADVPVHVPVGATNADVVEAGPSRAADTDESVDGYSSDTTVFSLAVTLYDGNVELATQALATTVRNPNSYKYSLPLHISDPVVPFKRYLDDCHPNGGRIFLLNPTLRVPDEYTQYIIWNSLLRHMSQKSARHPHYDYWRAIASGTSNLVPFKKHLAKLRPITQEIKRNVDAREANGWPKRTKGTFLVFGPPLENAEKGVYRL